MISILVRKVCDWVVFYFFVVCCVFFVVFFYVVDFNGILIVCLFLDVLGVYFNVECWVWIEMLVLL